MHKELEFINSKVIIKNDDETREEREIVPNIKEILISENDIEEMENTIDDENRNINRCKKKIRTTRLHYYTLACLWGTSSILHFTSNDSILVPILFLINAITHGSIGLSEIKPERKYIKISKQIIDVIKEHLYKEKEHLKRLKENTNVNTNSIDMSKANLSTSEKIINLKEKLNIIHDYLFHKNKYIRYYKKGILENKLHYYDIDKINLITELIKNDLSNEKEIIKQKTFSK